MSDVRLSNGSPPLERVDARLADHTRPPVCRNLFGGAEAAELRRDCAEQLREQERALQDKYNFDFARDEPLSPGHFEWVAVDGRSVPDFYSRPPRGAEPERGAQRAAKRKSPSPEPSAEGGDGGGSGRREARKRRSQQESGGASGRKRAANGDAEEARHGPPEPPTAEQTPRKSPPPDT